MTACPSCGEPAEVGQKFCTSCSAPLTPNQQSLAPAGSDFRMFVVLGACLVLAVVLGIGFALMGKAKDAGGPDTLKQQEPQARAGAGDSPFSDVLRANLLRARMAANESSAVGSVRTLNAAEVTYATAYPQVGFTCPLAALGGPSGGGICTANSTTACLIDQELASGQRSGYRFALQSCSGTPAVTYQVTAEPLIPGTTGQRAFCSDQSGVIRFTADGSGTSCLAFGRPLQ